MKEAMMPVQQLEEMQEPRVVLRSFPTGNGHWLPVGAVVDAAGWKHQGVLQSQRRIRKLEHGEEVVAGPMDLLYISTAEVLSARVGDRASSPSSKTLQAASAASGDDLNPETKPKSDDPPEPRKVDVRAIGGGWYRVYDSTAQNAEELSTSPMRKDAVGAFLTEKHFSAIEE